MGSVHPLPDRDPAPLFRWYFGAHSLKSLERSILGFCGIGPVRSTLFGLVGAGGDYLAALEGAEAVVFTGGIGENAPEVRRRVCDPLGWIGVRLDPERNQRGETRISADGTSLPI